ncbi:MAG: YihY family inner membrane protein [Burkholderiaceae bacterium]|nr:YihY family inner membrane protein [Burkholderiaceae bacterium]
MASLSRTRGRLVSALEALLRVDRWPQHARQRLERAREVVAFAARRGREVNLAQVAGSLTFASTLSIVPLLAVALSAFAVFPLFAEYRAAMEKTLLHGLLPPQISATILGYLNDFAANAAGLTAWGLLFLAVTALLMIHTVDRVLNDIWKVQARRSVMARVLVYWTLLTLGPLAIGASLSATANVMEMAGAPLAGASGLVRATFDLLPFVIGGLALAALYVLVPYRRVDWHDALIGGFVASALGELLSWAFAMYIRTGSVAGIYGAFSAVPLFLLWVYLSWYAVLFGAAIAATAPMLRSTRFADERRAGDRFVTALALLRSLWQSRAQGLDEGRMTLAALARAVRFPEDGAERLLGELERLDYVSRLDGAHAGKWLLTCDPGQATLRPLFARLAVDPRNTLLAAQPELGRWLEGGFAADWLQQPLAQVLDGAKDRGEG